jgi:hypothetical protein
LGWDKHSNLKRMYIWTYNNGKPGGGTWKWQGILPEMESIMTASWLAGM